MPYTAYNSVAKTGLAASGGVVKEQYIPLWVYSSGTASATGTASAYLQKGTTSTTTVNTGSAVKLVTLSANWNPTQKFALEASFYSNNASYTAYAELYDITGSSWGYTLSSTATTATLQRGSTFTLIPGHTYALAIFSNNASGICYLTKAHLVAIN